MWMSGVLWRVLDAGDINVRVSGKVVKIPREKFGIPGNNGDGEKLIELCERKKTRLWETFIYLKLTRVRK